MKVLNVLRNKPICNEAHFILVGLLLTIISVKHLFFGIFLLAYLVFLFKKLTNILIHTIIICGSFLLIYQLKNLPKADITHINDEFIVIEESEYYYILKGKYKILVSRGNLTLNLGDSISADIEILEWKNPSYKYDFNQEDYYKSIGVSYRGKILEYELLEEELTIYKIKYVILSFYEKRLNEKSFIYFKALLLNVDNFNEDIKNAYSNLFLLHLLVISGMHFTIISKLLTKLFQLIFKIEGKIITNIILFFYLALIGFPVSASRAFLVLLFNNLNEIGKIKYTKLDIYSFSFISLSLINPLCCYQMSFILSFLVSFILIFTDDIFHFKTKLKSKLATSFLCIMLTLPLSINISNELSLFNIVISLFLTNILGEFLIQLTLILIVIPNNAFEFIYYFLDNYLLTIGNIFNTYNIASFSFSQLIIYYVLFFIMIYYKKKITVFIFTVFFFLSLALSGLYPYPRVTFIDVGQGDSTLIELPYRQKVILIDTYNNIDYLKTIGINKIDILILTHFDNDHSGNLEELKKEFKIDKIYYSYYESNSYNLKMEKLRSGDRININGFIIDVLAPITNLNDSNANSLVLRLNINNKIFLLTGDATIETEELLISKYKSYLKADVLKVGHHGSKTSSSSDFLYYVNPQISIVSVGKDNLYGLPNNEVLKRLKKLSSVYLTSENGNISIIMRGNKLIVDSYK